jgi:hypothetical protein
MQLCNSTLEKFCRVAGSRVARTRVARPCNSATLLWKSFVELQGRVARTRVARPCNSQLYSGKVL